MRSMKVGGIRRVVIPPSQGYQSTSQEPIPPNVFPLFSPNFSVHCFNFFCSGGCFSFLTMLHSNDNYKLHTNKEQVSQTNRENERKGVRRKRKRKINRTQITLRLHLFDYTYNFLFLFLCSKKRWLKLFLWWECLFFICLLSYPHVISIFTTKLLSVLLKKVYNVKTL